MRILFLSRYQNKNRRGAESFVMELSQRLSKRHDVTVFSEADADSISKILQGKYDIVIPINGRLQALKASLGRWIGKYKLLISGHSGIGRDDIWNITVVRPDVFVVLTDFQKNWARKFTWGTKLVKIPDGVDIEKFKPVGEKTRIGLEQPIILSVGALEWYKYHERVIKAVAKIPDASLLVVGEGSKKKELLELGQKLLGERFKIANFDYQDMPKVYISCDLFTLPSWDREAFGIVYLEAMASGLGIVAPDDSPRHEIIGNGGLFVNVTNPQKYALAIEGALKTDWSKKGRKQAEKFSWDKIAIQYEELLENILKNEN